MQVSSLPGKGVSEQLGKSNSCPWEESSLRKPNFPTQSDPGHPSFIPARLLWAHLGFLSIVFVQKSLDAGPVVRMDITEVLDLKPNDKKVNCPYSPLRLASGTRGTVFTL